MLRLTLIFIHLCLLVNLTFGTDPKVEQTRTLEVLWYTSTPFVEEDSRGNVVGIEPQMFKLFQDYMLNMKGERVNVVFKKAKNFVNILDVMRQNSNPNAVGASALSITSERKQFAQFTESYLPDVTVLVSSKGTPIVDAREEKTGMLQSLDAITIKGTKYEALLENLKEETGVNFETIFIESDQNIIDGILSESNRFGFIDLPIYLIRIEGGEQLTRQNFFTHIGQGYAFMIPQNSEWKDDLNEFLMDPNSQVAISKIISDFLGEELYEFIENLYGDPELSTSILTKEKELQLEMLKNVNLRLSQEIAVRRILIVSISVVTIFLFAIGYLFYKNQKNTNLLIGQKGQIEEQEQDIRQKNEQLMNRNAQLVALNEEKNNLVKILAHDIRSPVSQIIMITDIINKNIQRDLTETEQKMLGQVTVSAERINNMVSKILDVDGLEETRIKVLQERVDVRSIMRDVAQRYRPIAAKKNIDLSVEFCEDHNIIRTDHLLLLLVLENLVSNAVKFSDSNTSVELISECNYDNVVFKITDEGPGFSDDDKKKLFNKFQKLSAKPTGGEVSTGLGLSIVKKYVQDLGGKVWVESEEGKGSTFFVKITA
ncbi:ATP-binding protein [Ekhidna sp.]|uniref:ATP-binding protein n=1 Tax=Ekhidna sp. TaxID=2608089 RepID=UPI00329A5921